MAKRDIKEIEFTEDRVAMMEALIRNGYGYKELGEMVGASANTFRTRLHERGNEWAKARIERAVEDSVAKATMALEKIATGYYEEEITYSTNFKEAGRLHKLLTEILRFVPDDKIKTYKFRSRVEAMTSEGMSKRVKKYYPPNKDAAKLILEAHNPKVWDLEMRRKQIPQVKIIVHAEEPKRLEEVRADFEVIN